MYKKIAERQSVPDLYKDQLINKSSPDICVVNPQLIEQNVSDFRVKMEQALEVVNKKAYKIEPRNTYLNKKWSHMQLPSETSVSSWATGCDLGFLKYIGNKSVAYPQDFVMILKNLFFK